MTILSLISESLRQLQKLHDFARFRISARYEFLGTLVSSVDNVPLIIRLIHLALFIYIIYTYIYIHIIYIYIYISF